jgi:hypothetical protein
MLSPQAQAQPHPPPRCLWKHHISRVDNTVGSSSARGDHDIDKSRSNTIANANSIVETAAQLHPKQGTSTSTGTKAKTTSASLSVPISSDTEQWCYDEIYAHYRVLPTIQSNPIEQMKVILSYSANALVVLQECCLSCYVMVWYRLQSRNVGSLPKVLPSLLLQTTQTQHYSQNNHPYPFNIFRVASVLCMGLAFLLVSIVRYCVVTDTSTRLRSSQTSVVDSNVQHPHRGRTLLHAIALAFGVVLWCVVLLYDGSTTRSDTNKDRNNDSCSNGTYRITEMIESFAMVAMVLHVVFYDYTYANAFDCKTTVNDHPNQSNSDQPNQTNAKSKSTIPYRNSAVWATAALVIRSCYCRHNMKSEITTSIISSPVQLLSLSILFFVIYPKLRRIISIYYPASYSGTCVWDVEVRKILCFVFLTSHAGFRFAITPLFLS